MARDYFQDITPPEDHEDTPQSSPASVPPPRGPVDPLGDRSIRNISVPQRPRSAPAGFRPAPSMMPPRRPRRSSRLVLWIIVIILVVAVALIALLFLFRSTSVSVIPQSQPVVFDATSQFSAYPSATAATGTLPYTIMTTQLTDSEDVQASGEQEAQTKANGTLTVANDYSTSPVTLVATTRFETQSGLIFRAPDAIVIPGKQGTTSGTVNITVVADQAGAQYNIGPTARFTLPGLQSTPDMYANIYAYSTASTTGGFSGEEPAVAPAAQQSAITDIEGQLQQNAQAFALTQSSSSTIALADLMQITYQSEPNTQDSNGNVSVNESAQVEVPVFPSDLFAETIASTVAADSNNESIALVPGPGFGAQMISATSTLGSAAITFSLTGQAQLVWNVDTASLAQALAGHGEDSFQAIVSNFPGVQSASARIEPFWETTFPSNPSDIHITVEPPQASGSTQSSS